MYTLKGHKNIISSLKCYIDIKDNNQYLISADLNHLVIIWEINNNYNIKHKIKTNYDGDIYSCLLVFSFNNFDNYILTSTYNSNNIDSFTKIYSFETGKFIRYLDKINNNKTCYLLLWINSKNNEYYIIQLSFGKIFINYFFTDKIYTIFNISPEKDLNSGFISNDYLYTSSFDGYIRIFNLLKQIVFKVIQIPNCSLTHIIQWNYKYIIVSDIFHKAFKIIDLEQNKVVSNIGGQHTEVLKSIKKIYHPIYGESLLSASWDKSIKLWII